MKSKNNAKFQATWVDMMTHGYDKELKKRIYDAEREKKLIEIREKKEFARNLRWLKENSEIDYFRLRRLFAFHVTQESSYMRYRTKTIVEHLKNPRQLFYNLGSSIYNTNMYYDYSTFF